MSNQQPDEEQATSTGVTSLSPDSGSTTRVASPAREKATFKPSSINRLKEHLKDNVDPAWADIILILCFFISGIVDSVAFNVWTCFASMQTGNTIFIGLGVSNQPYNASPFGWAKSLTAVVCFLIGAFSFSTFHRICGPTRRYVLISSFTLQTTLIGIAAILGTVSFVSTGVDKDRQRVPDTDYYLVRIKNINWHDLAPLAFLAFQSSGQVVASRMLKYNELPTVVLTSLYCDLMSDANLLTAGITEDPKRNRRIVAAIMLLSGAISGGYIVISWIGLAGALWIAAGLKACITLAWCFWRSGPKTTVVLP